MDFKKNLWKSFNLWQKNLRNLNKKIIRGIRAIRGGKNYAAIKQINCKR